MASRLYLQVSATGRNDFAGFDKVPNTAAVMREGRQVEILAEDLVPGDICIGRMGTRIPADLRIISCSPDLRVDMMAVGLPLSDGGGRGYAR